MRKKGYTPFGKFRRRLNELPRTVAASIAKRAAPVLTDYTQVAYGGPSDVYGKPRRLSEVDGSVLDLHRTGDARDELYFDDLGVAVRVKLGTPYTKYLVGKYRILPNGPLPAKWRETLDFLTRQTKAPP